jgi:hypothetical protein
MTIAQQRVSVTTMKTCLGLKYNLRVLGAAEFLREVPLVALQVLIHQVSRLHR